MTYRTAVCLAAAMLALAAVEPVRAQPFPGAAMPPPAVIGLVRASGFEPMTRPVLQGSSYVLRAVDPVGTNVRIVVDAERGEIVSARPLDPVARRYQPGVPVAVASPYGRDPRLANIPPGMEAAPGEEEYAPGPPPPAGMRANPGGPAAGMPAASRAAPSAPVQGRTPLPRSRPVESAKASASPSPDAKPAAADGKPAGGEAVSGNGSASPGAAEHPQSPPAQEADRTVAAPPKAAAPPPAQPLNE